MLVINLKDKLEYEIDVTKTGENYMTCPVCSPHRKKEHQKLKCFSFNYDKKVGRCNHCDVVLIEKRDYIPEPKYKKPTWDPQKTKLSENILQWFKARGIGIQTLLDFNISQGMEFMPQTQTKAPTIQFNYFENGHLVNIKYRDRDKNFKMVSDAKLTFYNIDAVLGAKQVIICEGEMDCLSFHEAGFRNVISVPNGANMNRNNLTYLDNCIDSFLEDTEFILATDNDIAGHTLRDELVRRLGAENCFKVSFRDCKDANEVLVKYGRSAIKEILEDKKPFPISGVFTADDLSDEIYDLYKNGMPEGYGIGDVDFDDHLKFQPGYMTIITGIPNHGKGEVVDFISTRLNIEHDWKFGIYSPENEPLQLHFSKYAEKLIGKGFNYMTSTELETAKNYFNDNFFFIKPEEDNRLGSILDKALYLVKKKGIKGLIIDPWNKIDHQYSDSETRYISQVLDQLVVFCEKRGVHLFLVAHPTKMQKDKKTGLFDVPNLYSINGSSHFFNKTHNGITVYRRFIEGLPESITEVYFQKVKFKHWGKIGMIEWRWNWKNGRYHKTFPDENPWLVIEGKQPVETTEEDNTIPF